MSSYDLFLLAEAVFHRKYFAAVSMPWKDSQGCCLFIVMSSIYECYLWIKKKRGGKLIWLKRELHFSPVLTALRSRQNNLGWFCLLIGKSGFSNNSLFFQSKLISRFLMAAEHSWLPRKEFRAACAQHISERGDIERHYFWSTLAVTIFLQSAA